MLRSILAVIVAYVAMSALVMAGFSGLLFGVGIDGLLEPGTWKGNTLMCIAAPGITVACGLFGGWLCTKIARRRTPVLVLAGLVLGFGMMTAYFTLQKPEPTGPRPQGTTLKQFMEQGREPTWFALLNPVLGAAAVLLGGCCMGCCRKSTGTPT
jgi:hypothetical protein